MGLSCTTIVPAVLSSLNPPPPPQLLHTPQNPTACPGTGLGVGGVTCHEFVTYHGLLLDVVTHRAILPAQAVDALSQSNFPLQVPGDWG